MGLELDLSELAALRPIRTVVSGARVTPRPDDDGELDDAAGTGCFVGVVTPTRASGSVAPRRDGGVDDDTGCVTPRRDGGEDVAGADTGCATPTSAASVLRPATVCPPAPRKPMPAKRKRHGRPTGTAPAPAPRQRFFFPVPHDLATVFVARVAASPPPPPPPCPPAKKIRLHVVG